MKVEKLLKKLVKIKGELDMVERNLKLIIDAQGKEKSITYAPELYKESLRNNNLERHLFIPDIQIPDHNPEALSVLLKFIPDFKPHTVHILGDFLNFTKASTFIEIGGYDVSLAEEVEEAKEILNQIVLTSRQDNPKARICWYEGNHELRLQKFLAREGNILTSLQDKEGNQLISVPAIFGLKDLGVDWIPYYETNKLDSIEVEHGDVVRVKAGFTAQAMLEKRGKSGFSGHSHRLALVTRSQGDTVRFWVECGSLCNLHPTPIYTRKPDWINGFAVGIFDKKQDIMHPIPILMQKNQFWWGETVYK